MSKLPETQEMRETYKLTTWPWSEVDEPGCYWFHNTGHLVRVPDEAISPGRSPLVSISSRETVMVTKLSSDPYLQVSKARQICADNDLVVNF